MAFFNPHTHPLLPQSFAATLGSDGIPEMSTEPSLSVVTDDTSSEDWVVSLNSAPISERAASTGPGSYVAVFRSGTQSPMSSEYEAPTPAPLAFPQHNGSGSFNRDRINEWRLDQSQLVLRELRRFEREHEESPTPESVIASWSLGDEHDKKATAHSNSQNANINALWNLFARRVSGFMGITDEVQEIIAGERYLDSKKNNNNNMLVQQQPQTPQLRHYNQALQATPGWETMLINKVFTELHIPRPFWQYFSFWFDKRTAVAGSRGGASSSLSPRNTVTS